MQQGPIEKRGEEGLSTRTTLARTPAGRSQGIMMWLAPVRVHNLACWVTCDGKNQPLTVITNVSDFYGAFLSGYYKRWGRDLSFLEVWRQMANYYRTCGLLKSATAACRPMRMACSNMHMACSNMSYACSNMYMTFSNTHMTMSCSNMNMVTLGVYNVMHDSAHIPTSTAAMHHHPPTTRCYRGTRCED